MESVKDRITITEAAERLHVDPLTLRYGIESGQVPFGMCIKMGERGKHGGSGRNTYVIPRAQFERWISGEYLDCKFIEERSKNR